MFTLFPLRAKDYMQVTGHLEATWKAWQKWDSSLKRETFLRFNPHGISTSRDGWKHKQHSVSGFQCFNMSCRKAKNYVLDFDNETIGLIEFQLTVLRLGRCADNQNGNLRWYLPWKGGGSRGGLECHIPILKNDFLKNHLESFPDCENVFCT